MEFGIQFDFDSEGDPPAVYIADQDGCGSCYVEVLEDPVLKVGLWSSDADDWEPGPLAKAIVGFMNSPAYNDASR